VHYRLVGGKGGVGKTTCAAAIAVQAAQAGRRVLLISTDPAPSLGDVLGRRLGHVPSVVPLRGGSLHAVEVDAARALDRWLAGRRTVLEEIALRGTWLDRDDVARLLRLALPGIDEVAALLEIIRFARSRRFNLLVVDTAPTGHTLRMLAMPDMLRGVARVFDEMQAKHRVMVAALRGEWIPDVEQALIEELDRDGRELAALLRDPDRVRTSWITLAEPMAVEETADAAASLQEHGIPVHDLVVNRLTPEPSAACGRCDSRILFERRTLRALHARIEIPSVLTVLERDTEPRGIRGLASVAAEMTTRRVPVRLGASRTSRWRSAPASRARVDIDALTDGGGMRLLMFGGKGGVGKTTCAAAAAIAVASRRPERRVLLLSTDPAHSLGDVFGAVLSDTPRAVHGAPANLALRELDSASAFRRVRERYAAALDTLFDRLSHGRAGVGLDAGHDRRVMHGLMDLAPPGIDELAAVIDVVDALQPQRGQPGYDLVVMDTAPSGHALRLLEMPSVVQDWAKALMSILLKYQPLVGVGGLGAVLLNLSQGLGRLRSLLVDPARTVFVAVTRAAVLPRAETSRLVVRLTRMHIHVRAIVINAVGRGTCGRCLKAAAAERREIVRLRRSLFKAPLQPLIAVSPAEVPPPHGPAALRRWGREWRALERSTGRRPR
jgi:arsenite-transporting ATPase